MNIITQALNTLKSNITKMAVLSFLFLFILAGTLFIPTLGGLLIAIEIFLFQQIFSKHIQGIASFQLKQHFPALIIIGTFFYPALLLMGSADSLLKNQLYLRNIPIALLIYILVCMLYLFLATALEFRIQNNESIVKALDASGSALMRNFKSFFITSIYLGAALSLGPLTWSISYLVFLPLLFTSLHLLFRDANKKREAT